MEVNCTQFCMCDFYDSEQPINKSFFLSAALIILFTAFSTKISTNWFVFKDYYPLKQKSPILCILLGLAILLRILIYPSIFILHYFIHAFRQPGVKIFFRSIQVGLEYIPYLIYFARAMRLSYSHDVNITRSKSLPFKIFQKQILLAMSIVGISILRALPVIFTNLQVYKNHFKMMIEYSPYNNEDSYTSQNSILYSLIFTSFIWQIVLIYCFWLQKSVSSKYSMKMELLMLIFGQFILSVVNLVIGFTYWNQKSVLSQLCDESPQSLIYPVIEILTITKLMFFFFVSLVVPLFKKKIYHRLLPTGRHYGFVKTMRDFLMEKQFMRVFSRFLEHLDEVENTTKYSDLLTFWKELVVLRFKKQTPESQKLYSIQELVSVAGDSLLQEKKQLINSLKDSIISLQDESFCSEMMRQKHKVSINQKVDELEKTTLQKLDKIFVNQYRQTQSYYSLREITQKNKHINLNMIMLNMVLIVDSEHQFD